MKKIIILVILVLLVFIPIFNYTYPWRLDSRFPNEKFTKLEVHEFLSKRTYSITNEKKLNLLYKYISKQRGRKDPSWFTGGLHGLYEGDEHYTLIFTSPKDGQIIFLYIINNKTYLKFTDGTYCLDGKDFKIKEFKKYIK